MSRALAGILASILLVLPLRAIEPSAKFTPRALSEAVAEGNRAYAAKDYATARRAYERVLSLEPQNSMGLVNLGLVEFSSGDSAKAETLLKQAVALRIDTAAAWLTLGMIYMDQNRFREALAALSQTTLSLVHAKHGIENTDQKKLIRQSRVTVTLWGLALIAVAIGLQAVRGEINLLSLAFGMEIGRAHV